EVIAARENGAFPPFGWAWHYLSRFLAVWTLSFGSLVIIGFVLSATALRASQRLPTEATGHARGIDAWLRSIYRVVLWVTCGFYYISMPIVSLLVVGAGGGLMYAI